MLAARKIQITAENSTYFQPVTGTRYFCYMLRSKAGSLQRELRNGKRVKYFRAMRRAALRRQVRKGLLSSRKLRSFDKAQEECIRLTTPSPENTPKSIDNPGGTPTPSPSPQATATPAVPTPVLTATSSPLPGTPTPTRTATSTSTPRTTPSTDGLVLYLSFNQGSGLQALDSSGNNNHGLVQGAVWNPDGKFGGALEFDGMNSEVVVTDSDSLDLTTAMTLEAWVRPTMNWFIWQPAMMETILNYM